MTVNIHIQPSYIKGGIQLKEFQEKMRDFGNSSMEIAILNAPTGAGKTYGFKEITVNGFILLLLPNNLLSIEVYKDFNKDTEVGLVNSQTLFEYISNKKSEHFSNLTKDTAINAMLSGKKIIITNPEIFYYIMLNRYKTGRSGDSLTDFIIDGLKMVIIDEVHIYSRDQTKILLSMLKLLRKDVKKLFSSATIPATIDKLIHQLFDEKSIVKIDVKRESIKTEGNVLLQGPINVIIPDQLDTAEFIKFHSGEMEKGFWFVICDSIRNIQTVYNQLLLNPNINPNDIELISAYHDSEYTAYKNIYEDGARIIIGSNIIEQGINPPKKYNNFIIEPGLDIKNFIQRFGRIGRNCEDLSKVVIIFKSKISDFKVLMEENNFENFIEIVEKKLPETTSVLKPGYIGVYAAIISENFSFDLNRSINYNIISEDEGTEFSKWYFRAKKTLSAIKKIEKDNQLFKEFRKEIRDLRSIIKWWHGYHNSILQFIPESLKIKGIDITDRHTFSYDAIWIRKNKNVVKNDHGFLIVSGFNERPNYNFHVYVKGMPVDPIESSYKDVTQYKARSEILERLKEYFDFSGDLDGDKRALIEGLRDIVIATADYERLSFEEIDFDGY